MTYPELKITLDINDPETILFNIGRYANVGNAYRSLVVCDDGDCHLFNIDGREISIDRLTEIDKGTFAYYYSLARISIPDSVVSIGESAFENCVALTSVVCGSKVEKIKDNAFAWCLNLVDVKFSSSVVEIGQNAFLNCDHLAYLEIPDSTTFIGNWAFSGCSRLKTVSLGNNVEEIGVCAFSNCYSLSSLVVPSSVKCIDESAFHSCPNLKCVLFKGKTMKQVKAMDHYPWGTAGKSIIQAGL